MKVRDTWLTPAALTVVLAGVLCWPGSSAAQVDPRARTTPRATLSPPELEITRMRNDQSVALDGSLRVLVGVTNNGDLPGEYDYALGPTRMDAVWWRDAGTRLLGGDDHRALFTVSHAQLLRHLGTRGGGGVRQTCLGLFLVRRGSTAAWTDADNDNHRQRVCFDFYYPPN